MKWKWNTLKTVYKLSLPEPASFFSYEGPFLCQRMNTYVINTEFSMVILNFIIYPSIFSVVFISQSVIWCYGSLHCGFSESISPLSETDDIVHNVFLNTNAWGIVRSFISLRAKYVQSTLSFFKMKPANPTPKHKHIFLMHFEWFSTHYLTQRYYNSTH